MATVSWVTFEGTLQLLHMTGVIANAVAAKYPQNALKGTTITCSSHSGTALHKTLIAGQEKSGCVDVLYSLTFYVLTLKCLGYFSLPFVHKGGPLGPIHFWVLSRRSFGTKLAPYVYTPKTTIYQQKEWSKNVSFQNGGQKNEFSFRKKSHVSKIWKTTFPKEFFNKIWLKIKEHEYIYIFEIKFEKNYSV